MAFVGCEDRPLWAPSIVRCGFFPSRKEPVLISRRCVAASLLLMLCACAPETRPRASATVRVIKPGDQVTMDFNAARLNIDVDAAGNISAVRCG